MYLNWVWFLGVDTIIMNQTIDVRTIIDNDYNFIIAQDYNGLNKEISVIDLGAGVNGFSYVFFNTLKGTPKGVREPAMQARSKKINYVGVEAVGQLVELMNYFFNTLKGTRSKKIKARAFHLSLFEIDELKKLIKKQKKPRVVFLFKVIDSLEVLERNYSKKLLEEIVPLADKVVLSFATRSLGKRRKFSAQRSWIKKFIEENFEVLDNFELGGERYLIFQKIKEKKKDL